MANSASEMYLKDIGNFSPDALLATYNISLPGLPPNMIQISCDERIPEETHPQISQEFSHSIQTKLCINDIASLSATFSKYILETQLIAICGDEKILVLNENLEIIQTFSQENESEEMLCVNWGIYENEIYLAAGGKLGEIYIINITNAHNEKNLKGHLRAVNCLSFMPNDCSLLLSGSDDFSIRMWNVKVDVQLCIFESHTQGILAIDWHISNQIFLSGGKDSSIKIWSISSIVDEIEFSRSWSGKNFPTKQLLKPSFTSNAIHQSYVDCAKFYGNLIISKAQEGKIIIWKPAIDESSNPIVLSVLDFSVTNEIFIRFNICNKKKQLIIGGTHGEYYIYHIGWESKLAYTSDKRNGIIRNISFTNKCIISANNLGEICLYNYYN